MPAIAALSLWGKSGELWPKIGRILFFRVSKAHRQESVTLYTRLRCGHAGVHSSSSMSDPAASEASEPASATALTIYTSELTGSDENGLGTEAQPYKTATFVRMSCIFVYDRNRLS
jgi:hypothetical protein